MKEYLPLSLIENNIWAHAEYLKVVLGQLVCKVAGKTDHARPGCIVDRQPPVGNLTPLQPSQKAAVIL